MYLFKKCRKGAIMIKSNSLYKKGIIGEQVVKSEDRYDKDRIFRCATARTCKWIKQ